MFHDKGIILSSAVADNIKVILALFQDSRPSDHNDQGSNRPRFLARPIIRKIKTPPGSPHPYKNWMTAREIAALRALLDRASQLMDEYEEGTLDLCHLLSEDEDARQLVATDATMHPTVATAFD